MSETKTVVIDREFAAPPEKLWRALTQPHLLQEWLMKNDFEPKVGHQFRLTGDWGGVLDCEVLNVEPNRTLAYTWHFAPMQMKTVVTFTPTPTATGTHLTVEQAGFPPDQPQAYGG